jgi:hypothetical protein
MTVQVDVRGSFTPAFAGSFYRSNGDPGDPPSDAEFEIKKVFIGSLDITAFLPPDFDWNKLEADCIEKLEEEDNHGA